MSSDGKTILFQESGEGGGPKYAVYLRPTDGSPAIRLGEGAADALSPDGKSVIVQTPDNPEQLRLLPTGAGETQPLTKDTINHQWARWLPDAKHYVFAGNETGHGVRLYVQDISGSVPRAISPEGVDASAFAVSPDGQFVAGVGSDEKGYLYPVAAGDPKTINGLEPGDVPMCWTQDGHALFVYHNGEVPAKVFRLDLTTGKKTLWKQIVPLDPTGVSTIGPILMTPDGKTYVYGFHRTLGDLYLVEGLK
jgi:Tol biopolymer transport system component